MAHSQTLGLKQRLYQAKDMVPQNSAEPLETRKELAEIAGVSHDTFSKAEKILEKGTLEHIERTRKGVHTKQEKVRTRSWYTETNECKGKDLTKPNIHT